MGSTPCLLIQRLQADHVFRQFMYSLRLHQTTKSDCFRSTFSNTFSKGYLSALVQWLWSSYMSKVKQGSIWSQNSQKCEFSRGSSLWTSLSTYPKTINMPPSWSMPFIFWQVCQPVKKCKAWPQLIRSYFQVSFKSVIEFFCRTIEHSGLTSLNLSTPCCETDSICQLMSMPLTDLKSLQKLSNIFPVPTAMSRQLYFFQSGQRASERSSMGYSGLYFSQLMPWVLKLQMSMLIIGIDY